LRAGRLDAQYFQPKFEEVETFLARQFGVERIGQWGKVLKGQSTEYTDEGEGTPVVRSGDLTDLDNESGFKTALPGQPLFLLRRGDVCISSIGFGSIGKVQVFDKPANHATVSEVTVIRQKRVNPYYLHFFLRSPFGQMQIERYITGATGQLHLYPKDVEKIYVPLAPEDLQDKLEAMTHESRSARHNAKRLLERAKRAVELAIEESEAAGMAWLET